MGCRHGGSGRVLADHPGSKGTVGPVSGLAGCLEEVHEEPRVGGVLKGPVDGSVLVSSTAD